ncbi:hypothetical protein PINS_up008745 [Pythium insidiosum]|nr:hypothetical protein PINS_up008745 [Pythium insidiosum]
MAGMMTREPVHARQLDEETMEAFVVPPRVYSRKRKVKDDGSASLFLSDEAYQSLSITGDAYESKWYHAEEQRRQLATAAETFDAVPNSSVGRDGGGSKASHLQAVGSALTRLTTARPTKHLAWLQYDRKVREQTPGLVQAENMARRLSALSVTEHLEYVTLQKKRADAQRVRSFRSESLGSCVIDHFLLQHGLPAVLALTPTESEALSRLKKLLREEQVSP